MEITANLRRAMDSLQIVPSKERMDAFVAGVIDRCTVDAQLAPIWAEKLRYTYTQTLEQKYPDLPAAMGNILPIDTSVPPAMLEWEYFLIDRAGYADWIDDDGQVMGSSALTAKRFTGTAAEMGHKWDVTIFDLERGGAAGVPIADLKNKAARRYHEELTQWTWLFGDSTRALPGLVNHPNITVTRAPLNGGATSRLWGNKTVDEIAADVALLVDTIANNTIGQYFAATVYMPRSLYQTIRNKRLGAGDGFSSVLAWMEDRYKGDASGQGKVTFMILNEAQASLRTHPKSKSDSSGISGDFLLAIPAADKSELAFMRMRPFTQLPPQERDMVVYHNTHSKIGGCKCQIPLAVHRLDFGTT